MKLFYIFIFTRHSFKKSYFLSAYIFFFEFRVFDLGNAA